jgi:hypothetical protein
MFDTRIYMIDENDHEFEVDMSLLDEVGYLSGVYIEGPRISEEFILDEQQQFDAEMQYKDILRSIEEES